MASSVDASHFAELFEFAGPSQREDIRKIALQGLAQHSRDAPALNSFLCDHPDSSIEVLCKYLHVQHESVLGDVLTILSNTASDARVAEVLVAHRAVSRSMRLLDGLEASESAAASALKELTLIFLNNLTATCIAAIDDLLQLQDEDLKGFHLSKLFTVFERQGDDAPRDIKKWILQILVNVTRAPEGQTALFDDADWSARLEELLSSKNPRHRFSVAQVYRNTLATRTSHAHFFAHQKNAIPTMLHRLTAASSSSSSSSSGDDADNGRETAEEVAALLAESLGGALQSEEGIDVMDGIGAKKSLAEARDNGRLLPEVARFATEHILPFLDDVTDAYVMEDPEG